MWDKMDHFAVLVGENIRRIRRQKDYSQEYVAGGMEISLSTYARMERGTAQISIKQLKKLSEILGTSMEEILCVKSA